MELNIHLPTLLLLSIAVNLLVAGLLWAVHLLRERQSCFRLWAFACITFAVGSLLASARALVDAPLVTILSAHLFLGLSPMLLLAGIHSLMGLPLLGASRSSRILLVAGAAYLAGLLLFSTGDPMIARFLTALLSVVLFSLAIYRLSTIGRKPKLPFRVLQGLFAIHGLLMMAQVLMIATSRSGLMDVDIDTMLTLILVNHLLLAIATAMTLPLLAFTEAERGLRELAERDELTQLFNRRAFFRQSTVAFEQARLKGQSLTVLMIDLDHFKQINDRWGHAVGDQALRLVSRLMDEQLRDADIIGRIGGEEFAAVLNTGNRQEVEAITVRLLDNIAKRGRHLDGLPLHISASIGGVASASGFEQFTDLMDAADKALYEAKRKGRNRVELRSMGVPAN